MMENWTISCKACGNNHAKVVDESKAIGEFSGTIELYIRCPDCGKEESFFEDEPESTIPPHPDD